MAWPTYSIGSEGECRTGEVGGAMNALREDEIEARSARLAGSGSAVGRTMEPSDVRRGRGDVRRSGTTKEKK